MREAGYAQPGRPRVVPGTTWPALRRTGLVFLVWSAVQAGATDKSMRLLVAIEHHFLRDAAGHVYPAPPAVVEYNFWQRYLEVFEEVVVLARVRRVRQEMAVSSRADGPGVTFHDLPDYLGPWQYLRCLPALRRRVREAVESSDAFILRVPGAISQLAWRAIRKRQAPFAVEVVGDPWDALSPGAVRTILRPAIRRLWSGNLRRMCREASAASYVTREALQRRYPPGSYTWTTHFSSIELKNGLAADSQIEERIHRLSLLSKGPNLREYPFRIGFVGTFHQLYKAPDVLLRAIASCRAEFPMLEVALAGDGTYLEPMKQLARRLGLAGHARFVGALPPAEAVYRFLDETDLFVLPSRPEGLPRAMIEAMARGCPCIGSTVGGIPELLPAEDLVPPGDVDALARKIVEVLSDPQRMQRMATRNWKAATEYLPEVLDERRRVFYRKTRELAEQSGRLARQSS